jgi:hypothetical protein
MEMRLLIVMPLAQFAEHLDGRRDTDPEAPVIDHRVRFPAAFDAAPGIAFEAKNPKAAVGGIISARMAAAAPLIMVTLALAAMQFAGTAATSECGASCSGASVEDAGSLRSSL